MRYGWIDDGISTRNVKIISELPDSYVVKGDLIGDKMQIWPKDKVHIRENMSPLSKSLLEFAGEVARSEAGASEGVQEAE